MTKSLAVVCEGAADFETATRLADRVLCAEVDWIEDSEDSLAAYRTYRGLRAAGDRFLPWTQVCDLIREHGIKTFGHFDGAPGAPHAAEVRRALALLNWSPERPDAILLIRDDDGRTETRRGFEQARASMNLRIEIVVGLAHHMRESWILSGFDPGGDESQRLDELRRELSFDPCREPHRLADNHPYEPRSPKRVVRVLTNDNRHRQAECWSVTALAVLGQRGRENGLAAYLDELRTRLVPLFKPRSS
jgi:hypothetical protein